MAVDAGADALGLVFAPSPRQVTMEEARTVRAAIPAGVELVGVFVEEPFETVRDAILGADLGGAQFHKDPDRLWSDEDMAAWEELRASRPGLRVVQAIRARDAATLHAELAGRLVGASQVLLDAYVPGLAGGTGQTFDWSLVDTAKAYGRPIIMAGGLTPNNVAEAIRRARPWGVDVSSGVEAEPGRKDHDAVRRFIAAARAADADAAAESSETAPVW